MWEWLKACPLFKRKASLSSDYLDTVEKGVVDYFFSMGVVEGTTLQDLMAAGAATTAIWVSKYPKGFDEIKVKQGTYKVTAELNLKFEPCEEGAHVFRGKELVGMLNRSQSTPYTGPGLSRINLLMGE